MAETTFRHAAGRPTYEVRELRGDPPLDIGVRFECSEYAAAVEYACEYLGRTDPLREGKVAGLDVVRVDGATRDVSWTYRHGEETAAQRHSSLMGRWGYDVSRNWRGPQPRVAHPTQLRRTIRPLRRA
jgi:hypothetical protein